MLIIGIDGGQTSTKCVLADEHGRALGYGSGGALTHLAAQGSRELHIAAIRECVTSAFADARIEPQPIDAIGLGLTGVASASSPEAATVRDYVSEVVAAHVIAVESDAYTALLGAHDGAPGIIAIGGTGSNVIGADANGRMARAGGWGWLLADEGSAMGMGRDGLRAALHAHDRTGPHTMLLEAMLRRLDCADAPAVKHVVYHHDFGAKRFAALAEVVSECAARGDDVARGIIAAHARGLAAQVGAVARQLESQEPGVRSWPVAPIGGAFQHVNGYRAAFERELGAATALCVVVEPKRPPMFGAMLMAARALSSDR